MHIKNSIAAREKCSEKKEDERSLEWRSESISGHGSFPAMGSQFLVPSAPSVALSLQAKVHQEYSLSLCIRKCIRIHRAEYVSELRGNYARVRCHFDPLLRVGLSEVAEPASR